MKPKVLAFIGTMAALGNVLGLFPIKVPIPTPALISVDLHLSQLPALFVAFSLGPAQGAATGFLSLIAVTALYIKNPLVPFGNAILAGAAGIAARRFRPTVSGLIGEVAETPFLWFSVLLWAWVLHGVPLAALIPVITVINAKAFVEVFVSSLISELLLRREGVRSALSSIAEGAKRR